MSYKYISPSEINKEEFEAILVGDFAIPELCQAIVNAVHNIDDSDWLLSKFRPLLKHDDEQVRGVTVTCVGHIARLDSNANGDQLLTILRPLKSEKALAGLVDDAMDDVLRFSK